jgi:hypothetical protein
MSCTNPYVVNIPGPRGQAGTNGTNGTNGVDAFSYTTAQFFVPALGSSVVVPLSSTSFLPESVAGQFFVSIQGVGYMQVTDVTGLNVTLLNPASGVLGIPNAVPTTSIPSGSLVTLAGGVGPQGAPGVSGGAPDGASYICRTSDITLTNETALDSLSAGYMKTAGSGGAGAVSTVATVPVGDISGTLPIAKGGTNLTTAPLNKIPVGDGTTYLQKEIVGTGPIVVTNSAGNITISAPSISSSMAREFAYIAGPSASLLNSSETQIYVGTTLDQPTTNAQWNSASGQYTALNTGYFKFTVCAYATGDLVIRLKKNGTIVSHTYQNTGDGLVVLTHIEKVVTANTDVFAIFAYVPGLSNLTLRDHSSFTIERIDTL